MPSWDATSTSLQDQRRRARTDPSTLDFLQGGGWRVASTKGGREGEGGVTSHRGVLHPDEWLFLDPAVIVPAVERHLGFTLAELRTAYRQGRKTATQRELRGRIDARLLELRHVGGNLELLARVTGMDRQTIGRALARARAAEMPVCCAWHEDVPSNASATICGPYAAGLARAAV